jgi:hypothetical protein
MTGAREWVERIRSFAGQRAIDHAVRTLREARPDPAVMTPQDMSHWVATALFLRLREATADDARGTLAALYMPDDLRELERAAQLIRSLFEKHGEQRILALAERIRVAPRHDKDPRLLADFSGRQLQTDRWWFESLLYDRGMELPTMTQPTSLSADSARAIPSASQQMQNWRDRENDQVVRILREMRRINTGSQQPAYSAGTYQHHVRSEFQTRTGGEPGAATLTVKIDSVLMAMDPKNLRARPPQNVFRNQSFNRLHEPVAIRDLQLDAAHIEPLDLAGVVVRIPLLGERRLEHTVYSLDGSSRRETLPHLEFYSPDRERAQEIIGLLNAYLEAPDAAAAP